MQWFSALLPAAEIGSAHRTANSRTTTELAANEQTTTEPSPAALHNLPAGYVALFGYRGNQARKMTITKNEGVTGVTGAAAPAFASAFASASWFLQSG